MDATVPIERITTIIYLIRDQKVMLDRDLAELYGVETKQLKRAVRRNISRFPGDFMFELTKQELTDWRCQFGTSNADKIGLRYAPMAFTEQGVAMLFSPLLLALCFMPLEKVSYERKSKGEGGIST